jgi:2-hydroxychromene-2-carboxylate isomerase
VTFARRIAPLAMSAVTSSHTRAARRTLARISRSLRGRAREVHYFHQADDPYSHLAAQTLGALAERYEVALVPHLVAPPSAAAAPERALLEAHARRDAADVARGYWLAFPAHVNAPPPSAIARAQRLLAHSIARGAFVGSAAAIGSALWGSDETLLRACNELGEASETETTTALAAGTALRERLGHYLGAMFFYEGEWYWGVDRLHHLERRLIGEGASRGAAPGTVLAPRPIPKRGARSNNPGVTLEFFLSLRSPYTYAVTERVFALAKHYGVTLALKPVLPMVMRGLPVPRAKRLYIALDAKREAEDAGVPFGRICDPVGRPVERCFSLYPWARERGRAGELLLEFMRAAWCDGIDTGTDAGMRLAVERAGLDWREAQERIDRGEEWREELEANRAEMFALGLWGVPSFRVRGGSAPDYAAWGQDRLWRVEEEIQRRS